MKAFSYPLEQLLNVLRSQRDQRRSEYLKRLEELEEKKSTLIQIEKRLERARAWQTRKRRELTPSALRQMRTFSDCQQRLMTEQREQIRKAQDLTEKSQRKMRDANVEVRRLEKHRTRVRKRWTLNTQKEVARENDEISTALGIFRQRQNEKQ